MYISKSIKTQSPGLYNVTPEVVEAVRKSCIAEGAGVLCSQTPGAGVLATNTASTDVHQDIMNDIERVFPPRTNYSFAGLASVAAANSSVALFGRPLDFIIHKGSAVLGQEQGFYILDTLGGQTIEYIIKCI